MLYGVTAPLILTFLLLVYYGARLILQRLAAMSSYAERRSTIADLRFGMAGCLQLVGLQGAFTLQDSFGQSDLGEPISGPGGCSGTIGACKKHSA